MKKIALNIIKLMIGFFLFAVGIVMTINSDLGLSPWDAFHNGLSKSINITMGQASIGVGIIVVTVNSIFGEKVGWGTLLNVLTIGAFMDVIMFNNIIPSFQGIYLRIIMMMIGLFIIGIATYLYLSVGWGAGPRDGLMVVLSKKIKKPVGLIRSSIELMALILGYILGGSVGIGTFITVLCIGPIVQIVFKIFKFDVNKVEHKFIGQHL